MEQQCRPAVTGIVLAGGHSRRMGRSKAQILLGGKTLLQLQAEKLRRAGAGQILLSGQQCPALPGTRVVADLLPDRGPLGGLHACLQAAEAPVCLVLGVDIPLIPAETLRQLIAAHRGGVTVLRHGTYTEPLIGVYDSDLAPVIGELIRDGGAPVRSLRQHLPWHELEYTGPAELLLNCNTPEELARLEALAAGQGE